jgi:hypothetical protein
MITGLYSLYEIFVPHKIVLSFYHSLWIPNQSTSLVGQASHHSTSLVFDTSFLSMCIGAWPKRREAATGPTEELAPMDFCAFKPC